MGNRLNVLKGKNKYKQEDICKALNISKKTLYNYENGMTSIPADKLIEFSKLYKCSIDYILGIKKYTTITVTDKSGEVVAVISDDIGIEHEGYKILFSED